MRLCVKNLFSLAPNATLIRLARRSTLRRYGFLLTIATILTPRISVIGAGRLTSKNIYCLILQKVLTTFTNSKRKTRREFEHVTCQTNRNKTRLVGNCIPPPVNASCLVELPHNLFCIQPKRCNSRQVDCSRCWVYHDQWLLYSLIIFFISIGCSHSQMIFNKLVNALNKSSEPSQRTQ